MDLFSERLFSSFDSELKMINRDLVRNWNTEAAEKFQLFKKRTDNGQKI